MLRSILRSMFLFSLFIAVFSTKVQANEVSSVQFSDMPTGWSREAVESAVNNGLVKGYDGMLFPRKNLTRAELATVVNRAFGTISAADISNYSDVPSNAWYYNDLACAARKGTMIGADNKMFPNREATREEVFVVLARAINLPQSVDTTILEQFTDRNQISDWAANDLASMVENEYMFGAGGRLQSKAKITREEFLYVINQFTGYYISNNLSDSADSSTFENQYNQDNITDSSVSEYLTPAVNEGVEDVEENYSMPVIDDNSADNDIDNLDAADNAANDNEDYNDGSNNNHSGATSDPGGNS